MDNPDPDLYKELTGRIIAHHGRFVKIATDDGLLEWKPPHKANWVVGDFIEFVKGRPKKIKKRINELSRVGSRKGLRQALAANLDWLVVVTACGEAFKPGLIDRFAVAAHNAGIDMMIVLNKIDLDNSGKHSEQVEVYRSFDFPVYLTSAVTEAGVEELSLALSGSISSFVGHSGVGKSSIINLLAPGAERTVGAIHGETDRGRHTTSNPMMIPLPDGGAIIDSPGVRQFSPTEIAPAEVALSFPGFAGLTGSCKFRDCLHVTEPGCAILTAVDVGVVSQERYASYKRILESVKYDEEPHWRSNS